MFPLEFCFATSRDFASTGGFGSYPSHKWRPRGADLTASRKASSESASIPPRRRARGATWQKVTPKKLLGPKRDYDVINAKIIGKYDRHTATAALY